MPRTIVRKEKIVLVNNTNEKETIVFTLNIEANHVNNNLDNMLQTISNIAKSIPNYKLKDDDKDEKQLVLKGKKKKGGFGSGGEFV